MQMPPIIYGTAWKKERTETLVAQALRAGFRGIDTACQPKHYHEPPMRRPGTTWTFASSARATLTGITSEAHMREELAIFEIELTPSELKAASALL